MQNHVTSCKELCKRSNVERNVTKNNNQCQRTEIRIEAGKTYDSLSRDGLAYWLSQSNVLLTW